MLKLHVGPRTLRPVHADGEHQPYNLLGVQPLSPTIGAEITGVDLGHDLADETIAEVRRALLEYKVIFFRDQDISHRAARRVRPPLRRRSRRTPSSPQGDGYPEVMLLEKNERMGGYENVWHSDVTWRLDAVARARCCARATVPEVGGDTLFCDMYAAYEGLDDDVRASLDGLRAVHDFTHTFGRFSSAEELAQEAEGVSARRAPGRAHPSRDRPQGLVRERRLHLAHRRHGRRPRAIGCSTCCIGRRRCPSTSAASAGDPTRSPSGTTAPCSTTRRRTTGRSTA